MDVFVARQPIFNNNYEVVAYELLYRDSLKNYYSGSRADNVATSLLIANSFLTFGIEKLVGDHKAFINFDQYSITKRVPELLDPDKITVEILETVEPEAKFIQELKRLNDLGYTVALDDYYIDYSFTDIIDLSKVIKVDFFQNTHEEIESLVKNFKKQNKVLLAEKVETKEEYQWAKSIGFDLFQGYYFSKPDMQQSKTIDNNALQYMKLMTELGKDEPDFGVLSDILHLDIALTYRLLQLVNAIVKPLEKIRSIKHGIAILGVNKFKRWLTLSVVQHMAKRETSEITKYALLRTHFLTNISKHSTMKSYENELALLGTLSVLNSLLQMKMTDVIKTIPLEENISNTLIGEETMFSTAYNICLAYERGRFEDAAKLAGEIHYDINTMNDDYLAAVDWSDKIFKQLNLFK